MLYASTVKLTGETMVNCDFAVNRFYDVTQREVVRGDRELIAAVNALKGLYHFALDQFAQDLQCEPQWNTSFLCNILCADF